MLHEALRDLLPTLPSAGSNMAYMIDKSVPHIIGIR